MFCWPSKGQSESSISSELLKFLGLLEELCSQMVPWIGHHRLDCYQGSLVVHAEGTFCLVAAFHLNEVKSQNHTSQFYLIDCVLICGAQVVFKDTVCLAFPFQDCCGTDFPSMSRSIWINPDSLNCWSISSFWGSLFEGMSRCTGGEPLSLGWVCTASIFLILVESSLKIAVSMCMRDLSLFTCRFAHLLTNTYRGCLAGRVAMCVIALKQAFLISYSMGRRAADASKASVRKVLRTPVIARAPNLWMEVSFLKALTDTFLLPFAFFLCNGMHQTSIPYSIQGSATLVNSFLAPHWGQPSSGPGKLFYLHCSLWALCCKLEPIVVPNWGSDREWCWGILCSVPSQCFAMAYVIDTPSQHQNLMSLILQPSSADA